MILIVTTTVIRTTEILMMIAIQFFSDEKGLLVMIYRVSHHLARI